MLFRQPESYTGGIGNYVTSVYTGNFNQTVTLTFYMADGKHPAAPAPDEVVRTGA